jgi:hypothetical protein
MPQQCDVRLIVHDHREDIISLDGVGEPLGLAQRGGRLVIAAGLREEHCGPGVDQRNVSSVAGSMERRCCFG